MQTERQQDIKATALHFINEKGIQGLTLKNLSKKLGITKLIDSIFKIIKSKQNGE